jgi:hypothetical protein
MMSAGVRNAARGTARVEGTQMLSTLQHHGDALSFTPLLSRDQFFLSRAEVDASTEQLQTLSSSALTGKTVQLRILTMLLTIVRSRSTVL